MKLHEYGIQVHLEKGMKLDQSLDVSRLNVGYYSSHRNLFVLPSGRYSAGAFLGKGSYATILHAVHESSNQSFTMKLIDMKNVSVESVIRECIVHILLEKESEDEPSGPFVPRFYEVAFDPLHNLMILRTETIQDILYFRYKAGTVAENDKIIPHTIIQLAYILDFFYKRLKFNHRDCKPDNVLYNYDTTTGKLDIKLIDFGFSCLCWNGVDIHAGDYFTGSTCFLPSRDLTQYVYWTYTNQSIPLSPGLQKVFRDILTFRADKDLCRMFLACRAFEKPMRAWGDSYKFLDDRRIRNPQAVPGHLRATMEAFLDIYTGSNLKEIQSYTIPQLAHCTPDRVLKPQTRRCLRRDSPKGQQLLKLSKKYSTPSTRTLRRKQDIRGKI